MKIEALKAGVRTGQVLGLVAAAVCAFPSFAFASEEEESAGIGAILPDLMEFVPMLVAFVILAVILAKFGWPMFSSMLEKRENTIRQALEKSEEARVESERVLEEYRQQLADAKAQAAQIVAEAKAAGESVKADITARAQAEAADIIEKARGAIEAEKKAAIAELQGAVADTSVALAARLIGSDLNEAEHRKIIERYVDEAGSFNGN